MASSLHQITPTDAAASGESNPRSRPNNVLEDISQLSGNHQPEFEGDLRLLDPVLVVAIRRLLGAITPDPRISDRAMCGLIEHLHRRLLVIGHQVLRNEGHDHTLMSSMSDDCRRLIGMARSTFQFPPRILTFWHDLFRRFPEMDRLMSSLARMWVVSNSEFLLRLDADWSAIRAHFGLSETTSVHAITGGQSDSHNGGRTVMTVEFNDGSRVVYKPRCVVAESNFSSLLTWISLRDDINDLKGPRTLDRHSYGWIEYVAYLPLIDGTSPHRYYRRAGSLLCLCHVLGATDMHRENLIAHADMPVLIDLEALLQPRPAGLGYAPRNATDQSSQLLLLARLRESVISTGLVPPPPYVDSEGDIAGFYTAARAVRVSMADEAPRAQPRTVATNLPLLDDVPQWASQYVDDIVAGFESMHHFLAQHVTALVREDGPLMPFAATPIRYVHRATQLYVKLMRSSLDPMSLRDRSVRDTRLQRLAKALRIRSAVGEQWWTVLEDELRCLATLDIPYLTALPESTSLWLSNGEEVLGCLVEPSYESMIRTLTGARDSDAVSQIKLIRATYAAWERHAASVAVVSNDATPENETDIISAKELEHLNWG